MRVFLGALIIFGSVGAFEIGDIHVIRFLLQELFGIYLLIHGFSTVPQTSNFWTRFFKLPLDK